jgi:hypothetical protein
MTPKEKAIELVKKYNALHLIFTNRTYQWDKQCALIAVDEILKVGNVIVSYNVTDYWQEVKQEIEKL